jgi:glycine/D-amino acid oxidase-like deaminating enzyme
MVLLVVGGGLFGSLAAAYARTKGVEVTVFDAGLPSAASPAAAGLFHAKWAGAKLRHYYHHALPLLERLYGIRDISLSDDDGKIESFHFVPPSSILETKPVRELVTAVGDGWLEAGGQRYEGHVYVAAGMWCEQLTPGLKVYGKAGAAYLFRGDQNGKTRPLARGRQALAFVRDAGSTYFSDGTAERIYTAEHDRATLARAAEMGLHDPVHRLFGYRPYVPGGPVFRQVSQRTWLATGGRKLGTILGASFARMLVEEELGL